MSGVYDSCDDGDDADTVNNGDGNGGGYGGDNGDIGDGGRKKKYAGRGGEGMVREVGVGFQNMLCSRPDF